VILDIKMACQWLKFVLLVFYSDLGLSRTTVKLKAEKRNAKQEQA